MIDKKKNDALEAEQTYKTAVESANDYIENFDILETITNVGNDEVFTPRKTCDMMLDSLPDEVWHNPNYRWLNPATKNGIFEREIAIRLDEGLKDVIPDQEKRRKHILQNMIHAIGQTKFTANVARRTLYYCSSANRACDGILAEDGHYVNGYAIGNGTWFADEEGNIKTPCTDHEFVDSAGRRMPSTCKGEERKKYKCKYCGISGVSNYNDANQREKYAYELIHINHLIIGKHMSNRFFGGNKDMKFDIIIGNPPYQLNDGGAQASAKPIYQLFVDQAKALNPHYLCMIIPSRWMAGGKGLDDFRASMLKDRHIRVLHDYTDAKECFPNNEIKGGVCYFLWNGKEEGKCKIYKHTDGTISTSTRYLKEDGVDVFIRDERLIEILNKVKAKKFKSFMDIVSPRKPFGLAGDFFKDPKKYDLPPISDKKIEGGITICGLDEHLQRVKRYVPQDYPLPKKTYLHGYKMFMARNQGSGTFGEPFSVPMFAYDNEICTETFIVIGTFKTEQEMKNCYSYIKTKFFRALVGIRKLDQNASQSIYEYAPLLDFTKPWNDKELYAMFGLSDDDIKFIEENVQEMN
ncbi:MAG: Eco57I restriction-modification methylase domain-containing protein [Bacilli bacterium]|jgi:site-specific DNA-methyltransferase (adenine-specific)|nr:Eco57I restriction-modification methylase domain-containing protein [Bacilli bacterium]